MDTMGSGTSESWKILCLSKSRARQAQQLRSDVKTCFESLTKCRWLHPPDFEKPLMNQRSGKKHPTSGFLSAWILYTYTVLHLYRNYGPVEPGCSRKLVARMCLSNSKMVDNKCLRVDMLLASSDDVGSTSRLRWKEAQIGVFPKEAQLHVVPRCAAAPLLFNTANINALEDRVLHILPEMMWILSRDRHVLSQLCTNALHQRLRDDEPPCLQLQVHEQNLLFEQGLPKNVSNYIIINRPSVYLNEILRPDLMSPQKRLYISHLLIQAFWKCYGSKWMEDAWTKLRIHFMYTLNTSRDSEPQLFAHEPFLTIDFAEHEQRALSIKALIPSKVRALGIMLLELELGTTIESHCLPHF
jgi:hypothetical protein